MEAVARRATDLGLTLSRYRISLRKPFELAAAAAGRIISFPYWIKFRRPSRITGLAIVTAAVAAISLGTAMLWPASAAPVSPRAFRAPLVTQLPAGFTFDSHLDARRVRPMELAVNARAIRAEYVAALKAGRAAAERRARQAAPRPPRVARSASAGSSAGSLAASPLSSQLSGSPREMAGEMLGGFGWGQGQLGCLDSLWNAESGWDPGASNPSSGAYGIPQALPGSKMSTAGPDWETNPATQIRWGLGYIHGTYGSPCAAWGHEEGAGWY